MKNKDKELEKQLMAEIWRDIENKSPRRVWQELLKAAEIIAEKNRQS